MSSLGYTEIWTKPNEQAADWLLNVTERRRQYIQSQQEFSCLSVVTSDGQPSAHNPGRPTERKGMQLLDMDEARSWIVTIEIVESMLSPKKIFFLTLRRQAETNKYDNNNGRPDWLPWVQAQLIDKYGIDVADRTLREWWRSMVELTARVAIKRECC